MKLRKIMMVAGLTAAIASMSVFGAFAAEDDDDDDDAAVIEVGFISESDGRGGVNYHYVQADGSYASDVTLEMNGVACYFDENGTYNVPYQGAPTGTISGNTFFNTWSNLRIEGLVGDIDTETDCEDDFTGPAYNSIGNPRLTMDLYIDTSAGGTLEVYYLNVSAVANMSAADFANAFAQVGKGTKWTPTAVSSATIAGQEYAKVSFIKSNGAASQQDYYFRKLGNYMVVIYADGDKYCMDYMDSLVNSFVPAQ